MRCCLVVLVLLAVPVAARADASADVAAAVAAFVDGVAANKPPPVELFIPPGHGEHDDGVYAPVPTDSADTRAAIASSKLAAKRIVVSKGGASAWFAGELPGRVERNGKATSEPIRVSAFLVKDAKGWRVTATHWSTGERDVPSPMCGNRDEWRLPPSIPAAAEPIVKTVYAALATTFTVEHGLAYDTAKLGALISDDKAAYVIGSAPNEVFTGGAKIKKVFQKWEITALDDNGKLPARAALSPDGALMWLAFGMIAPPGLCTTYRTLSVLAKEPGGWRIVHQHYSRPTNPY